MANLATHLRRTWSYDGLEVRAESSKVVVAAVGPTFPISELCMDVCDPESFDATVVLKHTTSGSILELTPGHNRATALVGWRVLVCTAVAAALAIAVPVRETVAALGPMLATFYNSLL